MRFNPKVGVLAAAAAVLVAVGAFGLGRAPDVRADVLAANVWILDEHNTISTPGGAALYTCSAGPGALVVNTTNFPNTGAGGPLVPIRAGSSIFICVNTTSISPGVVGGTINYAPTSTYPPTNTAIDDDGALSFDSNDVGFFDQPSCTNRDGDTRVGEWSDDACVNVTGVGTDKMVVPDAGNNLNTVIVRFTCPSTGFAALTSPLSIAFPITIQQDQGSFTFIGSCRGEASSVTATASPSTVEIVPARSNTSHSLIQLTITDTHGQPIMPGRDVDFRTDRCSIETSGVNTNTKRVVAALLAQFQLNPANPASYAAWELSDAASTPVDILIAVSRSSDLGPVYDGSDANADGVPDNSRAAAVLGCNPVDAPGATPGVATIEYCVERPGSLDICGSVTVTVIGPPASITVAASPTTQRCGEKSTITATVKDAIGQNVSDHTRVEFVTNLGGTLAGTGAVAGFAGPVVPVSSTVGETFGGVATAFLLTSEVTSGPYEVVATSGGTAAFDPLVSGSAGISSTTSVFASNLGIPGLNVLGGVFSTPPVSAQVTVTCSIPTPVPPPAPTITAPRTGTGITPPSTGDAGLAGSSSASWTLFGLSGVFALSLAGLAAFRFARR